MVNLPMGVSATPGSALGVGVATTSRGVEHCIQLPIRHDEQQVETKVDLEDVTGCAARVGDDARRQSRFRLRADDAVACEASRLLQGEDGLLGGVAEEAGRAAIPVAETRKALLEPEHGRPAVTGPE